MADKTTSFWSSPDEKAKATRWLLGLSGTWIILTLMVDLEETSDLAVALGLVIMGSVLLEHGPKVFEQLGISTSAPKGGWSKEAVIDPISPGDRRFSGWAPTSGARILEA